jgi:short-chain fatty acids transporter
VATGRYKPARDPAPGVLERLGRTLATAADRLQPDPFLLAILLTVVTALLGIAFAGETPGGMLRHWGSGVWDLLEFSMQMCLILVTGYALAETPVLRRVIGSLASLPRSGAGAAALVCAVACVAGVLHWGLSVIVGALVARDTAVVAARRGVRVHYPLLGACGYMGMLVWHAGLSGTAPLTVATEGHFLADRIGVIPVGATLGSSLNLAVVSVLIVLLPWVASRLSPSAPDRCQPVPLKVMSAWAIARRGEESAPVVTVGEKGAAGRPQAPAGGGTDKGEESAGARRRTLADWLNVSPALGVLLGAAGLAWVVEELAERALAEGSLGIDLNSLNLIFLSLGLLLHGRPIAYARAVERAAGATAGIILQFPLYAGILGMIRGSDLLMLGAGALVAAATPETFPLLAFASSGVVNFFVPSGGGQWAVQGAILVEAASRLGVSIPKTVLALSYGDQWTNMIQPFWALPLLGVMRLRAQQVMGYASVLMLAATPVFLGALWWLPA